MQKSALLYWMEELLLYYEHLEDHGHYAVYQHRLSSRIVIMTNVTSVDTCIKIDECGGKQVHLPLLLPATLKAAAITLEDWLAVERKECQKHAIVAKIRAVGSDLKLDEVLLFEAEPDACDILAVVRGGGGSDAIKQIQEEMERDMSIEWMQGAIREERERLGKLRRQIEAGVPKEATGRERALLYLLRPEACKSDGAEGRGIASWIRRRSSSMAKSIAGLTGTIMPTGAFDAYHVVEAQSDASLTDNSGQPTLLRDGAYEPIGKHPIPDDDFHLHLHTFE